jgi:hypothetical protein
MLHRITSSALVRIEGSARTGIRSRTQDENGQ